MCEIPVLNRASFCLGWEGNTCRLTRAPCDRLLCREMHQPHQCTLLENKIFWNQLLPVHCRWWGSKATLSIMLLFRNKTGCMLLLCVTQSVVKQMKGSNLIILGPKLFLKLLIKCFSENAETVELVKEKQQPFFALAKTTNDKCHCRECVRFFFSVYNWGKVDVSYGQWHITPKNQWDPLNCLVTMDQKSLW